MRIADIEVPEGHLLVGVVVKPHGVRGEVSVELVGDEPARLSVGSRVFLKLPVRDGAERGVPSPGSRAENENAPSSRGRVEDERERSNPYDVVVEASRRHKGRFILKVAGVSDRDAAESLRGAIITVRESDVRPRPGQVFIKDLYGLEVVDKGGRVLGRVVGVLTYPAQDVLEIETPRGVVLLPNVAALVPEIDVGSGRIVVDPPGGVFEGDPI